MLRRGAGSGDGRSESRERGEALRELERALADVAFPIDRDALLAIAPRVPALKAGNGDTWTLAEVLTDVPVSTFTSPRHVAEVLAMRWQDFADLYRPGGTGGSNAPRPAPALPHDAATARAADAKAEWEREGR